MESGCYLRRIENAKIIKVDNADFAEEKVLYFWNTLGATDLNFEYFENGEYFGIYENYKYSPKKDK